MNDEAEAPQVPVPGVDRGGIWVPIGGQQYRVPPLNLNAMRDMNEALNALGKVEQGAASMPKPEEVTALIKLSHSALKRNYPAMTEEEVGDIIDMGNFNTVLNAVMGVSGLTKKAGSPGEAVTSPA